MIVTRHRLSISSNSKKLSFFKVCRTKRMSRVNCLLSRYYYRNLTVHFLRLQPLKIKKILLILNSPIIFIFMIKSKQLKKNIKIIFKWKLQQKITIKRNLKMLKIQKIKDRLIIFYCKIIMIYQRMSFLMKTSKK